MSGDGAGAASFVSGKGGAGGYPGSLVAQHSASDSALLDLCARLRLLAEEWQRLWAACPEMEEDDGPEVEALEVFSDTVWPGLQNYSDAGPDAERDPIGQLAILPAHTAAGRQARAAAVYAIEMAERYVGDQRGDLVRMTLIVVREAAGDAVMQIGESVL